MYDAYSKKHDQKWLWIILLLPPIGGILYLYQYYFNGDDIEKISENVKSTFVDNNEIKRLEENAQFAATHSNKIELAKEHLNVGNNDRAIEILQSCRNEIYEDDADLNMHLVIAYFRNKNYEESVRYGDKIIDQKLFENSPAMASFAYAKYQMGEKDQAEELFKSMDNRFGNYENRMKYAHFLKETKGNLEAKNKVEQLLEEINSMDSIEKKLNKKILQQIKSFKLEL